MSDVPHSDQPEGQESAESQAPSQKNVAQLAEQFLSLWERNYTLMADQATSASIAQLDQLAGLSSAESKPDDGASDD